jgi:hypothetical protein
MAFIYQCECTPVNLPIIEPIEAPLPFQNIEHFENWLREVHIPRTLTIRRVPIPNTFDEIDANKTECWGIFSSNGEFERCCQVYPETTLENFPEFENSLRGKIFSHNHFSSNSTLSIGDVFLWANLQMKEIRAVTENCTYVIKPLNQNWPNPNSLFNEMKNIWPLLNFDPSFRPDNGLRHMGYQILARERCFIYEFF